MATKRAAIVCIGGFLFSFVFHTCQMIRFEHGSFPLSHIQPLSNDNQFKHSHLNKLHTQNDRTHTSRLVHPFKASNNFHRDISLHRKTTTTLLSYGTSARHYKLGHPVSHTDTPVSRHVSLKQSLLSQDDKSWTTDTAKQQYYPTTRKPGPQDVNRVSYNPLNRLPSRQPVPISNNVISSRRRLPSRQPVPRIAAMRLRNSMPSRQPIPRANLRLRQHMPSRIPFPRSNTIQSRQPVPFQSNVIRSRQPVPSRPPVHLQPKQRSRSRQADSADGNQSKEGSETICVERDLALFPDRKPSRQPFPTQLDSVKPVRRTNTPVTGSPIVRHRKRPIDSRTRSRPRHTRRFGRGPMGINHSGSCSKLCSNLCVFGYVKDASGCQTCKCRRSDLWTCSNAYCSFPCPFGYEQDAFGCRTCKCTFNLLMDYLRGMLTTNKAD